MEPELWRQIEDLFHRALELDESARPEFVRRICGDNEILRREVESLLAREKGGEHFLESPAVEMAARLIGDELARTEDSESSAETRSHAESVKVGSAIGPYHLLELIGEGGMGRVWLAEQKEPVRRRVALKLIRAGMDTDEVVARFQAERQAVALMDHPAIAKVFDAGSTSEGRPYFVMEYVSGLAITSYCDRHKFTLRQRLELFILVCEGVQHAHQKAIIHRDLKPSNILVTEVDGKPMPRIIDFGVAKAISQAAHPRHNLFTRLGAAVGTLGYMSPEQAGSSGRAYSTPAATFILSESYCTRSSQAPCLSTSASWPTMKYCAAYASRSRQRPSVRVKTNEGDSNITAQNRGVDPPTLVRQLRGDVDAITLKALEKDRRRRYATASDLAADVERFLAHEPVSAHAPSALYRTGKYIRRHRLGVAVAAAVALLLVGVAIAQSIELRHIRLERDRANHERDRATRELNRADRITQFMTGMFKVSNPSEARGNTVTAREILDNASKEIDAGLSKDPELQAKMISVMADTYMGLGLYTTAEALLERAVQIQQRVLGPRNPETLASKSTMAYLIAAEGRYAEAEKLARETFDLQRHVLGPEHPDTLRSMATLGASLVLQGRCAEGEKLARDTLAIDRRVLGSENPETLRSMSTLASALGVKTVLRNLKNFSVRCSICGAASSARSILPHCMKRYPWWRL